jgi:hypothetical protein
MSHRDWCRGQMGCITPGAKPCRMCETAYNASQLITEKRVEARAELAISLMDQLQASFGENRSDKSIPPVLRDALFEWRKMNSTT